MYAAGYGKVDATKLLIEMGASKDATDSKGKTAKAYAEEYGQDATVALLS